MDQDALLIEEALEGGTDKGIAQANGLSTMSEVEAQQLGVAFNS